MSTPMWNGYDKLINLGRFYTLLHMETWEIESSKKKSTQFSYYVETTLFYSILFTKLQVLG